LTKLQATGERLLLEFGCHLWQGCVQLLGAAKGTRGPSRSLSDTPQPAQRTQGQPAHGLTSRMGVLMCTRCMQAVGAGPALGRAAAEVRMPKLRSSWIGQKVHCTSHEGRHCGPGNQ
jgi:hypothetical protein